MTSYGVADFISEYVISPIVRPDPKAFALSAALTGIIAYVSYGAGAREAEDFYVPLVMGLFVYFHHYNRGTGNVESTKKEEPEARQHLEASPPVGSDLGALADLLEGSTIALGTTELKTSTWAGDTLVVLALSRNTASQVPAFDSVAKRHASTRLDFVVASPEVPTTAVNVLKSQESGVASRTSVRVLAKASALLAVQPSARKASVFVLQARGGDKGGAALAWSGHVAALENFLDGAFGRDENSSSSEDEGAGK